MQLNRRGVLAGLGSLLVAPVAAKLAPVFNAQVTFGPFKALEWAELFMASGYSVIDFTGGDLIVTLDKDGVFEVS